MCLLCEYISLCLYTFYPSLSYPPFFIIVMQRLACEPAHLREFGEQFWRRSRHLACYATLFPTPPSSLKRSVAWRHYKRLRRRVLSDRLTDWVFELSDWLFVQLTDSFFISYLRNTFLIDWFRWYISALVTLATNNDVTTRNEIKTNSSLKHKIVASYAHFSGNAINTSNNTRVFNTKLCRGYPWTWRSVVTSLPQPYGRRIFCADVKLFHILSKI